MTTRKNLGVLVLGALVASFTQTGDKSLEIRVTGSLGSEQTPEITQDTQNQLRLREFREKYPTTNMIAYYVRDFNAFTEFRVSEIEAIFKEVLSDPEYWTTSASRLDKGELTRFYPFWRMGITNSQKLNEILSNPNSKKELEEYIIGNYAGMTRLDMSRNYITDRISSSFLPIFEYVDFVETGNKDADFVFVLSREAFEKKIVLIDRDIMTVSSQTNSLASYMLAKIYAEQIANGVIAGVQVSSMDMLSMDESHAIEISRASALMETYRYFRQVDSKSPETRLVGAILAENMRLGKYRITYSGNVGPKGMVLIEKLGEDYRYLQSEIEAFLAK